MLKKKRDVFLFLVCRGTQFKKMASPAEVVCGKKWHLDYDVHYEDWSISPKSFKTFCGGMQVVCSAHLGLVCFCAGSVGRDGHRSSILRTYWLNPVTYEFEVVSTAAAPQWFSAAHVNVGYVGADSTNMIVLHNLSLISCPDKMKVVNVMNDTFVQLQTVCCMLPHAGLGSRYVNPWTVSISDDGNRMAIAYVFAEIPEGENDDNAYHARLQDQGTVVVVFERSAASSAWLPRGDHPFIVNRAWASLLFLNNGSKLFVSPGDPADAADDDSHMLWDIATGAHTKIPRIAYGSCTWCGNATLSMTWQPLFFEPCLTMTAVS